MARKPHAPSEWPSRNPDPRWCALLMTARKELGFTAKEAAALVGLSYETLVNAEHAIVSLGKRTEPTLVRQYLREFARTRLLVDAPNESATLGELRVSLAQAIVTSKAANFAQAVRGTEGSADELIDGLLSAAIQDDVITPKLKERLLGCRALKT